MGVFVEYIDESGRDELDTETGSLMGVPVESKLSVLFMAVPSFLYSPSSITLSTGGGSAFIFDGQFDVDSISTGNDLNEFIELGGFVSRLTDISEDDGETFPRFEITFEQPIALYELVFNSTWSDLLAANDVLSGGSGFDYLFAYDGDDLINASLGFDIIDGGEGVDLVVYSSPKSTIQQTEAGLLVEGDTLKNIERIQFSDINLALDLNGSAGQTAKTLAAVLGSDSLSNKQYVGLGLQLFDAGQSLETVCGLALQAAGATTNEQVVNTLYSNLYGEAPTAELAQPFVDALNAGAYSQGFLAAAAAELTDDLGVIDLVGLAETGIEYV